MIWGGVVKSGSPTPRLMTSGMVARTSKNFRIPDGGTLMTRWARRLGVGVATGSVVSAVMGLLGAAGAPSIRATRSLIGLLCSGILGNEPEHPVDRGDHR